MTNRRQRLKIKHVAGTYLPILSLESPQGFSLLPLSWRAVATLYLSVVGRGKGYFPRIMMQRR